MYKISTRCFIAGLVLIATSAPAYSQSQTQADRINKWFESDKEKEKARDQFWERQHTSPIKTPGAFQQAGKIQKAGEIPIPKGWKAIKATKLPCQQRFALSGDTLFEFDKATLTPQAVSTLELLIPELKKNTTHPVTVEGHTDSKGSDEYNERLSFKRAERVKNWLLENKVFDTEALKVRGYGKNRPVALNTNPDGTDNPEGRQLNRRVEIVINTCVTVEPKPASVAEGSAVDGSAAPSDKTEASARSDKTESEISSVEAPTTNPPPATDSSASGVANTEPNNPSDARATATNANSDSDSQSNSK